MICFVFTIVTITFLHFVQNFYAQKKILCMVYGNCEVCLYRSSKASRTLILINTKLTYHIILLKKLLVLVIKTTKQRNKTWKLFYLQEEFVLTWRRMFKVYHVENTLIALRLLKIVISLHWCFYTVIDVRQKRVGSRFCRDYFYHIYFF